MTRLQRLDEWSVPQSPDSARARAKTWAKDRGTSLEEDGDRLAFKEGSQLRTRLLGGWFVSARSLPKRITVAVEPAEGGSGISLCIEDAMGLAVRDRRLRRRYEAAFDDIAGSLRQALQRP